MPVLLTASSRVKRNIVLISVSFVTLFGAYIGYLYQHLDDLFLTQQEYVPSRIYSDVTRVVTSHLRASIEKKLKNLQYATENEELDLKFTLHPVEYPVFLISPDHPTLQLQNKKITLHFDGKQSDASLVSIESEGKEVSEIYLEPELAATLSRDTKLIRKILSFDQIPSQIWKAILSIEDQHFLEHRGIDPRGVARAILVNLKSGSFAQGGSTITQQLVKNLMARRTKNIFLKINEVFLAILLEIKYDKEKILERYLNEVNLGQVGGLEVHGVDEGAQHFFGKHCSELNLAETALLAGLIKSPFYYSPYKYWDRAIERQRLVLKKMAETGQIAEEEALDAKKLPIRLAPQNSASNKAPFYTDFAKSEVIRLLKDRITEESLPSAGLKIYTALDFRLNSAAQAALQSQVTDPTLEGALISIEQSTGMVRALIGGKNYANSNFNRILNMKRQVGSTFKPFVYLTALTKKDQKGVTLGPGYPLEDAPVTLIYDKERQNWSPKNYEKEFLGFITLRKALAHSVNTVTARVCAMVGVPSIIETARALGIESEIPEVPSISLGSAELSPVELARAYATIANHGVRHELSVIKAVTDNDSKIIFESGLNAIKAIEPGPADLITDMMTSIFTEGTAKHAPQLGFDRPAAGKTGTTSNYRDAWFAGFTPQLTTVVWVGKDQDQGNQKPLKLTGASAALPVWIAYMKEALIEEPVTPFAESSELTAVRIDTHSGKLATTDCPDSHIVNEKYLKDILPSETSCENLNAASQKDYHL